jgi:hypothetical protein
MSIHTITINQQVEMDRCDGSQNSHKIDARWMHVLIPACMHAKDGFAEDGIAGAGGPGQAILY